jgi:hypothetical protein
MSERHSKAYLRDVAAGHERAIKVSDRLSQALGSSKEGLSVTRPQNVATSKDAILSFLTIHPPSPEDVFRKMRAIYGDVKGPNSAALFIEKDGMKWERVAPIGFTFPKSEAKEQKEEAKDSTPLDGLTLMWGGAVTQMFKNLVLSQSYHPRNPDRFPINWECHDGILFVLAAENFAIEPYKYDVVKHAFVLE